MTFKKKGVYIYANLLDINQDGEIDMISFLSPNGKGVALAIKNYKSKDIEKIHMLQDVTGDGKLDIDDINLIKRESKKIFKNTSLKEGQLSLFESDAEFG